MSATSLFSLLTLSLVACTDSLGRFEDFGERVAAGDDEPDAGAPGPDAEQLVELPNIDGTFLLGLAAVIAPDPPFQFLADVDLTGHTVDVTLTGLDRYTRIPVEGDPLVAAGVPVDGTGQFEAALQGIIPGAANVITGNELTVDVVLVGRIQTQDLFCGEATGMILKPIVLDIAGSTVGAVRVEPGMVGDDLPPPVSACP